MNTERGMTIKELIDFLKVNQKIIRKWIGKIRDNNFSDIAYKCLITQSNDHPVQFTHDEVLSILRAGIDEQKKIIREQKTLIRKQTRLLKKMSKESYLTAVDIAASLNISINNVRKRAAKEKWKFFFCAIEGGKEKRFYFATLPPDIQEAWQNNPHPPTIS